MQDRQAAILNYIRQQINEKGYPPSVREIGQAVGLYSSSTVHGHLRRLEEKGLIRRDPTKPRAIEIMSDKAPIRRKEMVNVPVVGRVTAGEPILAVENVEDSFPLPLDFVRDEDVFMLKVRGESMIGAGIFDGDFVIVRPQKVAQNGEIVVALLEDEATVKRWFKEPDRVRLQPENPQYDPIITRNVDILGKVIGLVRRIH
ncbi:MAG: transcriptional repressor LexA [Firmicutes bacterium]|nr:transcriptional repressor LexA [Bacillota bacterium]